MSFAQLLGQSTPGWQGRIKEAAYTSPGGTRIPFAFTSVSRETTKRTAEFEFSDLNNVYVQDNGYGGRRYPLACIFSGDNHDNLATAFEAALLEQGVGHLEHPFYGSFDAIPLGTITRRNDLVSEGNQSVVEVTFSTTLAQAYPSGQSYPKNEILASVDFFNASAQNAFADSATLDTVARRANFKNTVRKALGEIQSAFNEAQGITAEARAELDSYASLLNAAIDTFVGAPFDLARAITNLILAPGRIMQGLLSRLDGYGRMLDNIVAGHSGTSTDGNTSLPETLIALKNELALADLIGLTAVAGSITASTDTVFKTRAESLRAAEEILGQFDQAVDFRDARMQQLGVLDIGDSYSFLQKAAAQSAGFLIESSFALVPERRLVLGRNRTIIDVCAQVYQTTSNERLDFLIASNDLSGDEILELPAGRTIKYY